MEAVDERLRMLERRLGRTQGALALTLIVLAAFTVAGFAPATHAAPTQQNGFLHLRGLVIEDDQGRPRVLLGAPTHNFAGRRPRGGVNGFIPLGPNDRVTPRGAGLTGSPRAMGCWRNIAITLTTP